MEEENSMREGFLNVEEEGPFFEISYDKFIEDEKKGENDGSEEELKDSDDRPLHENVNSQKRDLELQKPQINMVENGDEKIDIKTNVIEKQEYFKTENFLIILEYLRHQGYSSFSSLTNQEK